jgi:nicotinamidase-related amidase
MANDPTGPSTALLLVDPYNDFLATDGRVYPSVAEVARDVDLHRHLGELLAAARTAGLTVAFAPHRRWRPGDTGGWRSLAPGHVKLRDGELFAAGTPGGDWYPDLAPRDGDVVATEHWGLSGFAHTDLDQQLRRRGVERIVLAGMTAAGCVEGTGRWAAELGYAVTLVRDATASFDAERMRAAVALNGPLYAEVLATDAVVAGMAGG